MMSENSGLDLGGEPERNSTQQPSAPAPLRLSNVLKLIVPGVIVLGGVYVFFGMFDGMKWISDLMLPPRVTFTGQVLFNGEPLAGALVFTQPIQSGLRGATATTDQEGRFKLRTEIEGDFLDGAYVGEHLVKVEKRYNVMSFGVAPLMTPDQYAAFDTSSLRIAVTEGGTAEIALEGEPNPAPPPGPPGGILQPRPAEAESAVESDVENAEGKPDQPTSEPADGAPQQEASDNARNP